VFNIVVPKVTLAELNSEQSVVRNEIVLFQINVGARKDDLRSMCLLLFAENQRLRGRLEEQEQIKKSLKRSNIRVEALFALLLPITLLSLLSFHVAVPLAIGWSVIACCVYVASLLQFTDRPSLKENARMPRVLLRALGGFRIRLQRIIAGLGD